MRNTIVLATLALALTAVAALDKPAPPAKPFHTEIAWFIGGKLYMTVRYWQDGENIRRDYEDKLPKTFLTTKDGTYIIVNHQDRGMRFNSNAKMLESKRIEDWAQWPMWDLDWFIKSFNAKRGEDANVTGTDGKTVKAMVYTYKLKEQPKTTATLWVNKATRAPIRVIWGKNENLNVPPSQLTASKVRSYQTKIEFKKYTLGDEFRSELFKAPAYVIDGGDGSSIAGPANHRPDSGGR